MTHARRILELLGRKSGLDDDEISDSLDIRPRQTVNQECRLLERKGLIRREHGSRGKIVNVLVGRTADAPSWEPVPQPTKIATGGRRQAVLRSTQILVSSDLSRTLLILPCSGKKQPAGEVTESGPSIAQSLGSELAQELLDARRRVRSWAKVDESRLVPAWQRYAGSLYQVGGPALRQAMRRGAHVIILSGGYGVVLATELIGDYEARLRRSCWPNRLLERVLANYAERQRLQSVRAFASKTTDYRKILDRVVWSDAGIQDAILITPEAAGGAMRKSPIAQGEGLAALVSGTLTTEWKSSGGLGIEALRMA